MSVLGTTDNTRHINRRGSAQCRSGGSRDWADAQSTRMPTWRRRFRACRRSYMNPPRAGTISPRPGTMSPPLGAM